MVEEGLISRDEAVARIDPAQLDQLLHPMIDPNADVEVATRGLNASPGSGLGRDRARRGRGRRARQGGGGRDPRPLGDDPGRHPRPDPRCGVLTAHGGMTSHAAVVARGMGKPCVAGCEGLSIDYKAGTVKIGERELDAGDLITIDGGTGEVIIGPVPLVPPAIDENFGTILGWADELRRQRAGERRHARGRGKAREFGAEGIGLCRTEHMFMADDRLPIVREMILARDEDEPPRRARPAAAAAAGRLRGDLRGDGGLPVTIRCSILRCTSSCRRSRRRRRTRCASGSARSTRRTRCSAPVVAGSGSSSPRSTRCRYARSCVRVPLPTEPGRRPWSRSCTRSSASARSSHGSAS